MHYTASDCLPCAGSKSLFVEIHSLVPFSQSIGFHDTTRAYNAILNVCARHGFWERARDIFEGMVEQDVPADARTFNALLKTCVKGGSLQVCYVQTDICSYTCVLFWFALDEKGLLCLHL